MDSIRAHSHEQIEQSRYTRIQCGQNIPDYPHGSERIDPLLLRTVRGSGECLSVILMPNGPPHIHKGKTQRTSTVGEFFGVVQVYFTPEGAANTLSFNQLERGKHRISWKRNSHFEVTLSEFGGAGCALRMGPRLCTVTLRW